MLIFALAPSSNNHQDNDTTVDQDTNSQQQNTVSEAETILETKLLLKRVIGFSLAMASVSLALLYVSINAIPYWPVFPVIYCYLLYFIAENIYRMKHHQQRPSWRKREDMFSALDAWCCLIFLASIHLKIFKIIPFSTLSSIPFGLVLLFYIITWRSENPIRAIELVTRLIYTLQATLVTLKMDGVLNVDWMIVFSAVCVCLGMLFLYVIAFCILFATFLLFAILKTLFTRSLDLALFGDVLGLLWQFIYYGLSVAVALTICGLSQIDGRNHSSTILIKAAYLDFLMFISLAVLSIIAFKPLARYLKAFDVTGSLLIGNNAPQEEEDQVSRPRLKFDVEKKDKLFNKLSSTYFLPIQKQLLIKDQSNIQRIKGLLNGITPWKINRRGSMTPSSRDVGRNLELKERSKSNILANLGHKEQDQENPKPSSIMKLRLSNLKYSSTKERKVADLKRQFSADDLDHFRALTISKKSKEPSEEKLCYICYGSPPNAVLMNCGHAGICYECAMMMMEKNSKCMECRGDVAAVYKVDVNPNQNGFIKGTEVTTLHRSSPSPIKN